MRTGTTFTARLAVGSVRALDYISTIRIVWCPEACNTIEIITKVGRWVGDEIARREVITPRVVVHRMA
jgi:hypothetical protein